MLEHQLLQQACGGDYDAFEQLQDRLDQPVRRFVRRLIGVRNGEDDIVQNVFIRLYYNMHRIDPVEKLRPYLFRIARNAAYDELREQGRFESVSLDEDDTKQNMWLSFTSADDLQSQPEELTHWLLLHLEVKTAIERLPELQRQTLILYAEEGLAYADIAVVMETNIGTVKSRLFNAKKMLRQLLKPETLVALESDLLQGENHND